jgi:predicted GNAT family acetyltransferase
MDWKHEKGRIFYNDEKGELMAEATYEETQTELVNIDHVYVNPVLRGQGVAEKVMLEVVSFLKKENKRATATCSYANAWFKKNKDLYKDIISDDLYKEEAACKIDAKH